AFPPVPMPSPSGRLPDEHARNTGHHLALAYAQGAPAVSAAGLLANPSGHHNGTPRCAPGLSGKPYTKVEGPGCLAHPGSWLGKSAVLHRRLLFKNRHRSVAIVGLHKGPRLLYIWSRQQRGSRAGSGEKTMTLELG